MNPKTLTALLDTMARMEKFMSNQQSPVLSELSTIVIVGIVVSIVCAFSVSYLIRIRKMNKSDSPAETITHVEITQHLTKFEERVDKRFEELTKAFTGRMNHMEGRVDKIIDQGT